jgi:hypothetical protein
LLTDGRHPVLVLGMSAGTFAQQTTTTQDTKKAAPIKDAAKTPAKAKDAGRRPASTKSVARRLAR